MAKISIIMPVYNAAEFLAQALDSVLNQTLTDIELIAVNDGSKDDSGSILDEYAKKDTRLKVIHQENGGPSAARNSGLDVATGEYLYFLDGDDFIDLDVMERFYDRAVEKGADLVIGSYDIFNGLTYSKVKTITPLVKQDEIERYDDQILWTFTLSNKLFKHEVVKTYNFRFAPVSYSEDGVFTMNFVYHAKKIVGLNKTIFHYRRVPFALHTSITSSVSLAKIKDYIKAHEMIFEHMKNAMLRDFPQYGDYETLLNHEDEMGIYEGIFLKKEINILLNQFYKKFWFIDEETIDYLVDQIETLLEKVNLDVFYQLAAGQKEMDILSLYRKYEDAVSGRKVDVAVFAKQEETEHFINTIQSLYAQTYFSFGLYVPEYMMPLLKENELDKANVIGVPCDSAAKLYKHMIDTTTAEYIIMTDSNFTYTRDSLAKMYRKCRESDVEVLNNLIFFNIDGKAVRSTMHDYVMSLMENLRGFSDATKLDALLGNKIFKVSYVRSCVISEDQTVPAIAQELMTDAFIRVIKDQNVIFDYTEDERSLIKYINAQEPDFIEDVMPESARSLFDPGTERDMAMVYRKLLPSNVKSRKLERKIINWISGLPVQNKVLFYSVRQNDKLQENMALIYDKVKGKKIIRSRMLPHDKIWKMRMYYEFATSKVIVVDDYARYLRLFPLKNEQKVIQLWHACGAFKRFGKHGTNLKMSEEKATHMQYNLVSVSAEGIRDIYASAFDLDVNKISALGVPRTDVYFDDEVRKEKQAMIREKHPELKGKRIYLYGPTFRDKNKKRDVFEPEIDFDDMSRRLPENTVFIIAPHPVMTTPILKKKYDNVLEIRDVSTNDLMFVSDLLITDYSSTIFEFSLLNKPICFYCYDKEIYNRGFYLDYEKDLPGEIFTAYEDFMDYLEHPEKHKLTEKHADFVGKYMSACDGHSTERIAGVINEYMGVR